MNPSLTERAEKAHQAAQMAADDIRELHRAACATNPTLEIVVFDLIAPARQMADRLARIAAALKGGA